MRVVLALAILLTFGTAPAAYDPPADRPARGDDPDSQSRTAAWLLSQAGRGHSLFPASSAEYVRFLSWSGTPEAELRAFKRAALPWWNHMSFEQAPGLVHDVPGSGGLLQWFDLREFRWNARSFRAVAERDRTFREPWVRHDVAQFLRAAAGIRDDVGRSHCEAIVWAPQLFRDTLETDRTPSYYDLLFTTQRFGSKRGFAGRLPVLVQSLEEEVGYDLGGEGWIVFDLPADAAIRIGDFQPRGRRVLTGRISEEKVFPLEVRTGGQTLTLQLRARPNRKTTVRLEEAAADRRGDGFVSRDFPKNADQWRQAFGTDVARAFGAAQRVAFQYGAVVEGGRDNPARGSIVALNNRLLVTIPGVLPGMESFDVFVTSKKRDYLEQSKNFPVAFFDNVQDKVVAFDASEKLNYLPNGAQAGFLTGGDNNRVEIAANKAASAQRIDPHLNPGVRNPGDCVLCHAPSGGYILPANLVDRVLEKGITINFPDREAEIAYRGFFRGWQKRARALQVPYQDLIWDTTRPRPPESAELEAALKSGDVAALRALVAAASKAKTAPGWTGAEWAEAVKKFRNWYDGPVDARQAAAELGVPEAVLKRLAGKVEDVAKRPGYEAFADNTARAAQLVRGDEIPRSVWDQDLFEVLGTVLYLEREK